MIILIIIPENNSNDFIVETITLIMLHTHILDKNSKQNFNYFSIFNFQKIFSQKGLNYPLDIIAIGIKVSMKRGAFETIWSKIRGRPVRCDAMTNFYKARSAAQSFTIC